MSNNGMAVKSALGSLKVTENGGILEIIHDFLVVCYFEYSSLVPFSTFLSLKNIVTLKCRL